MVQAVVDANKTSIGVIHSFGAVLMPWANHPDIKAIVWPGLLGQESGNSLADVLYGDVSPSGRLPYTIAKNLKDYPAKATANLENTGHPDGALVIQLYLSFPKAAGDSSKIFRGFEKVIIKAGHQSKTVKFELTKTELSIWDVASQSWTIPRGQFQIHVGASSRNICQSATFTL
ncbi:hypothetical protein [Absidia glauca]|uniref:beta-glucosidase n=1 Tax=Absidia glauca TaxID=4829 RepID=A0A168L5A8_ABSGL|nr:hypothetical protein [Absidia glauca]